MAQPKYGGRDCELSTTGVDARGNSLDPWKVTCRVLDELGPASQNPASALVATRSPPGVLRPPCVTSVDRLHS